VVLAGARGSSAEVLVAAVVLEGARGSSARVLAGVRGVTPRHYEFKLFDALSVT